MRPARGVACEECRDRKGHFCQAQIFVDGDDAGLIAKPRPLCLPCADGEPCVVERVGAPPAPAEPNPFEPEDGHVPAGPVIHRTPEELGLARVVEGAPVRERMSSEERVRDRRQAYSDAAKLMRDVAARRKRVGHGRPAELPRRVQLSGETVRMSPHAVMGAELIDPEFRNSRVVQNVQNGKEETMAKVDENAVLAIAGTMSDIEVGKQLGISGVSVGAVRKKHGIPKWDGKPAAKAEKPAKTSVDEARALLQKLTPAQMQTALSAVCAEWIRGL